MIVTGINQPTISRKLLYGIFGKLFGTPLNATARRAVLDRAPPVVA
jgi:hypothetical protein